MKILLYGSNYSPELTGIGKYTGEMARWFAARGHDVRVVTVPPHYPEWRVQEGYSSWRWSCRREDGVLVWRCPAWIPASPGGVTRLLHSISFDISSFPIMLRQLAWRPDVVWVVEPPLMCAPTAVLIARLARAASWLHVQDFEVDAAFELGLLRGRWAKSIALAMERWLMRRFDVVSTISGRMSERLRTKRVPEASIASLPNWVDVRVFDAVSDDEVWALRRDLDIPDGAQVVLYSGNMGRKQGLEILANVARHSLLAELPLGSLHFIFCGHGVARPDLERACRGLKNVRFLDLLPSEDFPTMLKLADIHLLPQLPQAGDLVMPSKLTGILASGRPVVATASHGTELERVASIGGLAVEPGDDSAMAAAIARLVSDEALRIALGRAGSEYARANLHIDKVLGAAEEKFLRLGSKRH